MENLGQVRLGVSRTSQIHLTSPNLSFPYFNFLGGGPVKKTPCILHLQIPRQLGELSPGQGNLLQLFNLSQDCRVLLVDIEHWLLKMEDFKFFAIACIRRSQLFKKSSIVQYFSEILTLTIERRISREKLETGYFLKSQWQITLWCHKTFKRYFQFQYVVQIEITKLHSFHIVII